MSPDKTELFKTETLLWLLIGQNLPAQDFDRTLLAIHAHTVSRSKQHCGIATANNSRDAQLARHNGGMRKRRAYIRDNRSQAWE